MPRKKKPKLREDTAETAYRVLQEAVGEREPSKPPEERSETEKNPEAVKRGRKGGKKGGDSRNTKLTARKRKSIARAAANTRWKNVKPD